MNPETLQELLDRTTRTVGTGFVIDSDGYIVTNEHVIEDSQQFWVTTDDHKVYPAVVVGADPRADLAVIKIPASHLPTVTFAQDSQLSRGQWTLTLGNPYGLATEGEMAVSVGVISAVDRSLPKLASRENRLYSDLIQTTAQINPGNSGGPLISLDGRVIGINTAVILPQKQTNGIGFAIPVTGPLLGEIAELRQGREVVYGYLGVTVTTPTMRQRHDAGIDDSQGVRVESIEAGSPAAAAKSLKEGDLVLEFNATPIRDSDQFVRLVGAAAIDKPASLRLLREGKGVVAEVVVGRRPLPNAVSSASQRLRWRGMVLGTVPDNWCGKPGKKIAGVLVVGMENDCPLRKKGITAGSVIVAVAGQPVSTLLDMQKIINDTPAEKCDVQVAGAAAMATASEPAEARQ